MTTEDQPQPIKLSEASPKQTAGQLPSSVTKPTLLDAALKSDDIDTVKAALRHVWFHYQALELNLHDRQTNLDMFKAVRTAVEDGTYVDDVQDEFEIATGFMAIGMIEAAHDEAHKAAFLSSILGLDPTETFKGIGYSHLDFSNPDLDFTDEDAAKLLQTDTDETTDETPKDEK